MQLQQVNYKIYKRDLVVKKDILLLGFILFLLYFIFFAPIRYLPDRSIIEYAAILIVGIYILFHLRVVLQKKYFLMNLMVVLFVLMVFISAFINRNTTQDRNPFLAAIVYFGGFCETLILLEIVAEKKQFNFLIDLYYKLTLITIIVTDFLIFFVPSLSSVMGYLVGTKFQVSYLHMQLFAWFLLRSKIYKHKKIKYNLFFSLYYIFSVFISIYLDCMTGTIALVLFLLIYLIFKNKATLLANPIIMLLVLLFFCLFLFIFNSILDNEYVQFFITDILGRDLTLTGRMLIYENLPIILNGHWLLGYGYGSAYEICTEMIGAVNAQNGILNWLIEVGMVSTILMLGIFFVSFLKIKTNVNFLFPVIVVVYCFSIIASVEICIDSRFLFWILFIYVFSVNHSVSKQKGKFRIVLFSKKFKKKV